MGTRWVPGVRGAVLRSSAGARCVACRRLRAGTGCAAAGRHWPRGAAASRAAAHPRSPLAPPPPTLETPLLCAHAQVSLTAVMVTQFPMRLSVYADQFEDVAAHRTAGGGGGDDGDAER